MFIDVFTFLLNLSIFFQFFRGEWYLLNKKFEYMWEYSRWANQIVLVMSHKHVERVKQGISRKTYTMTEPNMERRSWTICVYKVRYGKVRMNDEFRLASTHITLLHSLPSANCTFLQTYSEYGEILLLHFHFWHTAVIRRNKPSIINLRFNGFAIVRLYFESHRSKSYTVVYYTAIELGCGGARKSIESGKGRKRLEKRSAKVMGTLEPAETKRWTEKIGNKKWTRLNKERMIQGRRPE